jgi:hypothetical protein
MPESGSEIRQRELIRHPNGIEAADGLNRAAELSRR